MPNWKPFTPGYGPDASDRTRYFYNGKYQVVLRLFQDANGEPCISLSIRREDRKPVMDWRDIQLIKDQLLGPEEEMVQLFPAESRHVDTSNQYWFFSYPNKRFPFGFNERMLLEKIQLAIPGGGASQQRPFAPEHRPKDLPDFERSTRELLKSIGAIRVDD